MASTGRGSGCGRGEMVANAEIPEIRSLALTGARMVIPP